MKHRKEKVPDQGSTSEYASNVHRQSNKLCTWFKGNTGNLEISKTKVKITLTFFKRMFDGMMGDLFKMAARKTQWPSTRNEIPQFASSVVLRVWSDSFANALCLKHHVTFRLCSLLTCQLVDNEKRSGKKRSLFASSVCSVSSTPSFKHPIQKAKWKRKSWNGVINYLTSTGRLGE